MSQGMQSNNQHILTNIKKIVHRLNSYLAKFNIFVQGNFLKVKNRQIKKTNKQTSEYKGSRPFSSKEKWKKEKWICEPDIKFKYYKGH